ncbi:MAG: terpene cyclase/mutase family protein [Myxococcales bacterium]|nr:terpene cyclase/mutase family protein [Myxococcales bacterium]
MLPFHTILSREPLKPLMRSALYPVIYSVVTEFGGQVTAVQVKAMRKGIRDFPPRLRIEERQREDGGWDPQIDGRTELWEAALTLFKLADFGANQFDAVVQMGVDFVYAHQLGSGLFPLPLPENGLLLFILTSLGYVHNRDNNRLIQRILQLQRPDGGWGRADVPSVRSEEETPSDVGATLHLLLGLSAFEEFRDAHEMRRACDFLLASIFKRMHSKGYTRVRDWHSLYYEWDEAGALGWPAVKLLYILTRFGYERTDESLESVFRWVRDQQLTNGMWGHNDDGNEFLTIWVLRAVRMLYYPDFRPDVPDVF